MKTAHLLWVALPGLVATQACGVDTDVFGGSGGVGGDVTTSSGTGGSSSSSSGSSSSSSSGSSSSSSSGSSSSSSSGSSSSSSSGSSSSSSSGSSSSSSSSSSSGQGGAPPSCAHDVCDEGPALDPGCDPCVTQICGFDAFCCDNQWDNVCVGHVWNTCGVNCAPNAPTCEAQYGQAPGYFTCIQGADSCEFAANVQTASCGTLCAQAGGECLGSFNNQGQTQCQHAEQLSCQLVGFTSVICICSRGCGGGPPCPDSQQCFNGVCG